MLQTTPGKFKNPHSTKNKLMRIVWGALWIMLFRPTPKRFGSKWRNYLLRLFGAKLGNCWIHQSVRIWAPWELSIGNDVYIDEGVWLYNAFGCEIKDRVIISAKTVLCTATHDFTKPDYPLTGEKIYIHEDTWIAMQVFIMPGVTIGQGVVIGACSVVTKNAEPWTVVGGNPAKFIKKREIND